MWVKKSDGGGETAGNQSVLNSLGDSAGKLTYNGSVVGASGSGAVDKLNGKKWGIFGSSSSDDGFGFKMYYEWVSERTGIIPAEYADAGSTLRSDTTPPSGTNQLAKIDTMPTDLDVVVGMVGANDDRMDVELGIFTDRVVTTYYGALHEMCNKLLTRYPTQPLGIITHNYTTPNDQMQDSLYLIATKKVCAYYGIPVLDILSEGRIPYHHAATNARYVLADGLHPTEEGHKLLSYPIEAFLRRLFGG